jgi:hypothetical protein
VENQYAPCPSWSKVISTIKKKKKKQKMRNDSKHQTLLETPTRRDFIGLEKKRNDPIISYTLHIILGKKQ